MPPRECRSLPVGVWECFLTFFNRPRRYYGYTMGPWHLVVLIAAAINESGGEGWSLTLEAFVGVVDWSKDDVPDRSTEEDQQRRGDEQHLKAFRSSRRLEFQHFKL